MTSGTAPTRRLVLVAAGALLLPRAARAQPVRRRIALLDPGSPAFIEPYVQTFRQGLRALGYGEGDVEIDIRHADGHFDRLPDLATELVKLAPDILVAAAVPSSQAAKRATATIPIVMVAVGDPVAAGLVASLAHPGGNLTGLSTISPELAGKWLTLLKTTIPGAERIAILVNPANPMHVLELPVARQAAQALRTELLTVEAGSVDGFDGAFAMMMREQAQAFVVPGDPLFLSQRSRIVALAASYKLPAIYGYREFVKAGGLMSHGVDIDQIFRRAATYVDKILKGAKPADLPIEQPTKFQLVVNLKTAQALGLTVPPAILAGADEVIE